MAYLLARWVPIIEHWVGSAHLRPYKVGYLSKNSQNDCINLISNEICKLIAEEIVSAKFFAVIVDTTSDKSRRDLTS